MPGLFDGCTVFKEIHDLMEMICNKCGKVIPKPELKTIRDGEIEHTYFLCPDCGEAYRVSTTDKHLRKRSEDYSRMSARVRNGTCTKYTHCAGYSSDT